LPTEIKRYTVNRSTFIDKNSREQFELRIHKRLVEILNPNPRIVESLSNLNLPAGVDIEIKMV
jgi:small subunit ribosomal protein S10